MRVIGAVGACAAAALLFSAGLAPVGARSARVSQIPNGATLSCSACHLDPAGGGPRNPFGLMIQAGFLTDANYLGSVIWGPELAAMDADGDGATNGEELGDPEGIWRRGDDSPGDDAAVTDPADPASFPPEAPTAVQSSTWAAVKLLLQD